jgi:hypothetical protein
MRVSLCILACSQLEGVRRLILAMRKFPGLDVQVVIGDNSPDENDQRALRSMADTWLRVYDEELWYDGFGVVKQQIAAAAENDIIFIGDPDEVWEPAKNTEELLKSEFSVLRTQLCDCDGEPTGAFHGRVFDRRKLRLIGAIHEELYHRKSRKNWGELAPKFPVAKIRHLDRESPWWYRARKQVLYDNLLHRIYTEEMPRAGVSPWWWQTHWPERLEAGGFEPTSFEGWKEGDYHGSSN